MPQTTSRGPERNEGRRHPRAAVRPIRLHSPAGHSPGERVLGPRRGSPPPRSRSAGRVRSRSPFRAPPLHPSPCKRDLRDFLQLQPFVEVEGPPLTSLLPFYRAGCFL